MEFTEVRLKAHKLDELRDFYNKVLTLPLMAANDYNLGFQVGRTRLVFEQAQPDEKCLYHIAFNIPENQFAEAKSWLVQRTALLRFQDQDEVAWTAWNAHALYFYDPAGNVLELIARHQLPNGSTRPFSGRSLSEISEVGVAVDEVESAVAFLQASLGVSIWDAGDGKTFTALGNEHGLLIVVKRGRAWFPTADQVADFCPVTLTLRGKTSGEYRLADTPYCFRVTQGL